MASPLVVSINGSDNVGKTTQIALLPPHYSIRLLGSLHTVDGKLADLARHELAQAGGADVSILDRGTYMFEAVSIATIAVKNNIVNLEEARKRFEGLLATMGLAVRPEQVSILLKFNCPAGEAVTRTLERESDPVDDRYRGYQRFLHAHITHQVTVGRYQHIVEADGSRLEVQNRIRKTLSSLTPVHMNRIFTPLLYSLNQVYLLGGLSESGKSALANALQSAKASGLVSRLKIGYLCDRASARLGRSVYDLPEKEQALQVVHELHEFASSHYWLTTVTLESAHRKDVTQWMKALLGGKLKIVYMDTTLANRTARSLVSLEELKRNDLIKCSRGAHEIKDIADIVLDNNGSFEDTLRQLSVL